MTPQIWAMFTIFLLTNIITAIVDYSRSRNNQSEKQKEFEHKVNALQINMLALQGRVITIELDIEKDRANNNVKLDVIIENLHAIDLKVERKKDREN